MIILLILIICTATGYELKCPATAEWRLRAFVSCYLEDTYVCLFNLLEEKYMENCLHTDKSSIGSKLVFQPLFNLAECNAGRYQPIVFTTHGNSGCIFSKSKCSDEGQVVFRNDSFSNDVTCRCDYTKRYAFVTKPKNRCVCNPSEEDCSCFRVPCTKLSADYQCVTDGEILVNSTCQEILPNIPYNTDNNTAQLIESSIESSSDAQKVAYIIIASAVVYFILAVMVLLKVCVFDEVTTQIDGNKTTDDVSTKPNETTVADDISTQKDEKETTDEVTTQIDGNETTDDVSTKSNETTDDISTQTDENEATDDETQKFIHELFLKGECGKLHFARLVFIGKNGVGKTSLMRRLMWQNKEDVTSTQSTDGIEVEKCNINIVDGKWSPCKEKDDDLTRLIHQVYKNKIINVELATAESAIDQESLTPKTDESRGVSDKGFPNILNVSDKINIVISDDETESDSTESDNTVQIVSRRPNLHSDISNNINNHEAVEIHLNQTQPDNFQLKNVSDENLNSYPNENESDPVDDDNIKKMTSTIMKSYLKSTKEEQDEMLAFCWLWDFAGQKDFYATHQVFLSKCAVYLLVTDSLESSTVENQGLDVEGSAHYVSFWFDAIHCYGSKQNKGRLDPPIIVVCTNEDKIKEPLEREKRQEQFKDNLGQVLKDQKKKKHLRNVYFISNTEDADRVFEEIRTEISRQAMEMEDWGKDCPLKWLLFQQVLMRLKDNNVPISSTKTLLKIAKHPDINISEDNEVKQCLQYCHGIGTVVYFDEVNLADHVILDPKWLVNAFRCLVSDKISNVIQVSDDWQKLKDTGQLTDSLISCMFKKEPELQFEDNKSHLLEVMKRFDIIVNLKNSTSLYMPCMMKPSSFSDVQKQICDGSQLFQKTSWFCLEFKFLPPAFFNHIIAWYIKQYSVSVIIDKEIRSKRSALYRHIGVFDLDSSGCEKLVVCQRINTIALQIWDLRMSNKTYTDLTSNLLQFIKTLRNRYSLRISYTITFTCKDGDFAINGKTINDLFTRDYLCLEHKTIHVSNDLVQPWDYSTELQAQRYLSQTLAELRCSRVSKERGEDRSVITTFAGYQKLLPKKLQNPQEWLDVQERIQEQWRKTMSS